LFIEKTPGIEVLDAAVGVGFGGDEFCGVAGCIVGRRDDRAIELVIVIAVPGCGGRYIGIKEGLAGDNIIRAQAASEIKEGDHLEGVCLRSKRHLVFSQKSFACVVFLHVGNVAVGSRVSVCAPQIQVTRSSVGVEVAVVGDAAAAGIDEYVPVGFSIFRIIQL